MTTMNEVRVLLKTIVEYRLTCDGGGEWVSLFTGGSEERCDAGSHGDTPHRLCSCCDWPPVPVEDRQTNTSNSCCPGLWRGGERARPSKQFYIWRNHTNNVYFWRVPVRVPTKPRSVFPHKNTYTVQCRLYFSGRLTCLFCLHYCLVLKVCICFRLDRLLD